MNKKILKLTLLLGIFASFTTVVIAAVNTVTAPVIKENNLAAFNATVQSMFPTGSNGGEYESDIALRVVRVVEGGETIGFIYEQQVGGFQGPIVYLIGVDLDGNFIDFSANHSETPGIGTVIDTETWTDRIIGTHATTEIDTVAGATGTTLPISTALLTIYEDLQNRR
ncbi:MAG: FMN-binding protein [Defluviitaleaceae bacterium]|nr:FMN-binding protein [Defluviitaleaceae bacterium]